MKLFELIDSSYTYSFTSWWAIEYLSSTVEISTSLVKNWWNICILFGCPNGSWQRKLAYSRARLCRKIQNELLFCQGISSFMFAIEEKTTYTVRRCGSTLGNTPWKFHTKVFYVRLHRERWCVRKIAPWLKWPLMCSHIIHFITVHGSHIVNDWLECLPT